MAVAKRVRALNLRLTNREFAEINRAAKREHLTISDWSRQRLLASAAPPPPPVEPVVSGDQVELPLDGNEK